MEHLTATEITQVIGSLGVGGFLIALFLSKLFSFLEKKDSNESANRAIIEISTGLRILTEEIKDGFKENNALLRECRDWHRDNNAQLSTLVDDARERVQH